MSRINDAVKDTASIFAELFIEQRRAAIRKKAEASGALSNSFEWAIEQQAQREGISLAIAFLDAGRFIDMRPRAFSNFGKEAVQEIEKWLDDSGKANQFVENYRQKHEAGRFIEGSDYEKMSVARIKNHIAWGILKNRSKGKWKRRQVWNKPKSAAISDLINQIAAKLPLAISDDLLPIMPKNN